MKMLWMITSTAVLLSACAAGNTSERSRALNRVRNLETPSTFAFFYEAGGTAVLDCVLANREFVVSVDAAQEHLDITDPSGQPIAHRDPNKVLLAGRLFDAIGEREWLSVETTDSTIVRQVLGADISSYILDAGLPAPPSTYASELIEDASVVAPSDDSGGWVLTFADSADPVLRPVVVTISTSTTSIEKIVASGRSAGGEPIGFVATYGQPPRLDHPNDHLSVNELSAKEARPASLPGACEL